MWDSLPTILNSYPQLDSTTMWGLVVSELFIVMGPKML